MKTNQDRDTWSTTLKKRKHFNRTLVIEKTFWVQIKGGIILVLKWHVHLVLKKQLRVSHIFFVSLLFFLLIFAVSTEELRWLHAICYCYTWDTFIGKHATHVDSRIFFSPNKLGKGIFDENTKTSQTPNVYFFSNLRVLYYAIFDCLS